jgi:hypothetical protein
LVMFVLSSEVGVVVVVIVPYMVKSQKITFSLYHVLNEAANKNVAIIESKDSFAPSQIVQPLSDVTRAIWINAFSESKPLAVLKLSNIRATIVIKNWPIRG